MIKALLQKLSHLNPAIATVLVLLIAFLLRLPQLAGSFWLDEAAQVLESARPFSSQLDIVNDFQPPLLHYITHFAIKLGQPLGLDKAEWWLRTWAALIPGLITIFFTIRLSNQLLKTKASKTWVGLLAGIFIATSSLHIFYSQELRPYSLPAMWASISWWLLLKKKPVGLGLVTALGLFSSYLYPFFLFGQISYVLWTNSFKLKLKKLPTQLLALLGGAVLFLPWLPMFFKQLNAGGVVRTTLPGWSTAVSLPQLKALPLVLGKFLFGVIDLEMTVTFICLGLIVILLVLHLVTTGILDKTKHLISPLAISFFWLVIPLISAWLISFFVPVIRPKRVLLLLPGFYLGLSSLIYLSKSKLKYLLLVLLLGINIFGTFSYFTQSELQRENWRELIWVLENKYTPRSSSNPTVAVFSFPGPFPPWTWYAEPDFPTLSTGVLSVDQISNLDPFLETASDYQTLLVFDYLQDLTDSDRVVLGKLKEQGFAQDTLFAYPGIGFVREMKL
jgi:uncharacterized membrane protein